MRIEDKFALDELKFNSKFKDINSKKEDEKENSVSFADVLKQSIDDTNDKMKQADLTSQKFVRGEDVNIDEVMIKNQEASLSLQFLAQTRDKLLEGYNQLSRLQL